MPLAYSGIQACPVLVGIGIAMLASEEGGRVMVPMALIGLVGGWFAAMHLCGRFTRRMLATAGRRDISASPGTIPGGEGDRPRQG